MRPLDKARLFCRVLAASHQLPPFSLLGQCSVALPAFVSLSLMWVCMAMLLFGCSTVIACLSPGSYEGRSSSGAADAHAISPCDRSTINPLCVSYATRFIVECLTDNVNRSASDVKAAMTKGGAKPAEPGSVMFNFQRQGLVSRVVLGSQPGSECRLCTCGAGCLFACLVPPTLGARWPKQRPRHRNYVQRLWVGYLDGFRRIPLGVYA